MHDDMMVYICKSTGASVKWVIIKGNYLTHTHIQSKLSKPLYFGVLLTNCTHT